MRSRLLMAVLALAMIAPMPSARAEQQQAAQPAADEPTKQEPAAKGSERKWGDGKAVRDPRKQPAKGDPYNWRQMGFAGILMVAMLAFLIWLVRRQTRGR